MNLMSEINARLAQKITLYATPIYIDALPKAVPEAIMSRQDPGPVETRYMDGSRAGDFNFSYYAKSKTRLTANNQLDAIVAALDLVTLSAITGVTAVSIEVTTNPFFEGETDKHEYVYTVSFTFSYVIS